MSVAVFTHTWRNTSTQPRSGGLSTWAGRYAGSDRTWRRWELRSPTRYRYFTGGLVAGGEYLLPVSGGMNALQAIAAAGGYRQQGIIPPHQLTILSHRGPTRSMHLLKCSPIPTRSRSYLVIR